MWAHCGHLGVFVSDVGHASALVVGTENNNEKQIAKETNINVQRSLHLSPKTHTACVAKLDTHQHVVATCVIHIARQCQHCWQRTAMMRVR